MRLVAENMAFELQVVGYQFPANATDSVNWLFIQGAVQHPRGDWQFRDPGLLTSEVARLASWLQAVAAESESVPWCGFIEPNLSFAVIGDGSARLLRVSFAAESRPPWAEAGVDSHVEFPVSEVDLGSAVASLRQQLQQWPERIEAEDGEA